MTIEREDIQKIAAAIAESARAGKNAQLPGLSPVAIQYRGLFYDCADTDDLVVKMAQEIAALRSEREALLQVYVAAARLRTFPVPFDDHFALVGAVDECRSVLEPPVDHGAPPEDG